MPGIAKEAGCSNLTLEERCHAGGSMEMGLGATEVARLGRYRATILREPGTNIRKTAPSPG